MKILGIDFGIRRVGLALSDESCMIGFPYAVEQNDQELLRKIMEIVEKENVKTIAIGDARASGGAENPITAHVEVFAAQLKKRGISVEFVPELFSSFEAERFSRGHNDASAAAIILQRYLDGMKSLAHSKPGEIGYDDFAKIEMRIGKVIATEMIEGADKLIKCVVDFGEIGQRTIVSGIAPWKKPEELIGKEFPYVVNLAPRTLRGVESAGMLLAVGIDDDVVLLKPEKEVPPGTKLR